MKSKKLLYVPVLNREKWLDRTFILLVAFLFHIDDARKA
jgi:hypothetical protein